MEEQLRSGGWVQVRAAELMPYARIAALAYFVRCSGSPLCLAEVGSAQSYRCVDATQQNDHARRHVDCVDCMKGLAEKLRMESREHLTVEISGECRAYQSGQNNQGIEQRSDTAKQFSGYQV